MVKAKHLYQLGGTNPPFARNCKTSNSFGVYTNTENWGFDNSSVNGRTTFHYTNGFGASNLSNGGGNDSFRSGFDGGFSASALGESHFHDFNSRLASANQNHNSNNHNHNSNNHNHNSNNHNNNHQVAAFNANASARIRNGPALLNLLSRALNFRSNDNGRYSVFATNFLLHFFANCM